MDKARKYQGLLGWPETSAFKTYVLKNLLVNCNITVVDINRADNLYGEAVPILQGKTRGKKPRVHSKTEKIPLPLPISEIHKNLHL